MTEEREDSSGSFEGPVVMQTMSAKPPQSIQLFDFSPTVPSILDGGAKKAHN